MSFRTRVHGTSRQVGTKFPVRAGQRFQEPQLKLANPKERLVKFDDVKRMSCWKRFFGYLSEHGKVYLIGSQARKGIGHDIDLVWLLKSKSVPKEPPGVPKGNLLATVTKVNGRWAGFVFSYRVCNTKVDVRIPPDAPKTKILKLHRPRKLLVE